MAETLSNDSQFYTTEQYVDSDGSPSPESLFNPGMGLNRRFRVEVRKLDSSEVARVATILDFSDDY